MRISRARRATATKLVFAPEADEAVRAALAGMDPDEAVLAARGLIVRCTPRRVTTMRWLPVARAAQGAGAAFDPDEPAASDAPPRRRGAVALFCKARIGGVQAAIDEWHWLGELPRLGFRVAPRVYFARAGERTVVATLAADGRPLPALLCAVGRDAALAYACTVVAPLVRRLHGLHLVYRDLYWQHLFAAGLDGEPTFIDVERVLRPRLRWRRWVVKDLAGLVASWPFRDGDHPEGLARALVRAYCGRDDFALAADVARKATRITRHRPKFGT